MPLKLTTRLDRRSALLAALLTVSATVLLTQTRVTTEAAGPVAPVYTGLVKGVAVGGYDAVAYFKDGKPAKGDPAITLEHMGATWRFASAENRDAFRADPMRYAPQYGGYCAWAVSEGYTAEGDPLAWTVSDGKLYLNANKKVQARWEKAIPHHIKRGDVNWPKLVRPATP